MDTNDTTANNNIGFESMIIPLNRFSFEKLESKMLVPMQLQFNIALNEDNELIHMANGTDNGRLWLPKLIPKDSMYSNFVNAFMKESKWKYLREFILQQEQVVIFKFQLQSTMSSMYLFIFKKVTVAQMDLDMKKQHLIKWILFH